MKTQKINLAKIVITSMLLAGSSQAATLVVDAATNNHSTISNYDNIQVKNGSTLNLTSGALTLDQTSTNNNTLQTNITGASLVHVTGGTHTFKERMGLSSDSTFRITGNDATINVHQQSGFQGTLEFVFDSDGVSTFASDSYWGFANATLAIDASAYTGPTQTFTVASVSLFGGSYANSNGFGTIDPIIAPTGYTASYDQSQLLTNGQMTVTLTAVPEPSSTLLIGLSGLGLVLRRRK